MATAMASRGLLFTPKMFTFSNLSGNWRSKSVSVCPSLGVLSLGIQPHPEQPSGTQPGLGILPLDGLLVLEEVHNVPDVM